MTDANKTPKTMLAMILELGGREWQKAGKHRAYLDTDQTAALMGIKISRYNSGNIAHATRNGEKISNAIAAEYVEDIRKTFYDVTADKFFGDSDVAKALRARFAEWSKGE